MNDLFLNLPPSWQSATASVYGYYLKFQRYDRRFEKLVAEALERETWSAEAWRRYRDQRLAWLLERAATRVPYYREHWRQRRRRGDHASHLDLENWPILEKAQARRHARDLIADDVSLGRMIRLQTSGTTGTPLKLWRSIETNKQWFALFEARCRRWYGVSHRQRWAHPGGRLIVPVKRRHPPYWVWNRGLNQLYLSSYHLRPEALADYLDALSAHRIGHLIGYSSSLHALAAGLLRSGRQDLVMDVVVTDAEPLSDRQRRTIATAFRCPVRESYGMTELVAAASECENGVLHLWPEVGVVEVRSAGRAVAPGEMGDLVCTGLLETNMPLIRYRLGDRAQSPLASTCACGRQLPILAALGGRSDDLLYLRDGTPIGRLDTVFKHESLALHEAQLVQEQIDLVKVRYVPGRGDRQATEWEIEKELHARMGDIRVVFESLPAIPRGHAANAKFRAVVCELDPRDIAKLTDDR